MPIKRHVARWIQQTARRLGWEIRRRKSCIGEMEAFLEQLARVGFRPASILDVGANRTNWARSAKAVFPAASFLLVEPQAEMLTFLKDFCHESPGSRWKLAAAGPEPGELVLNIWQDHLAGSSLLPLVDSAAAKEQRRVPIVTIDSLYGDGERLPDFVKLDVQGFELEALKGAARLFGVTECFVMEIGLYATSPSRPLVADVVKFMDERGYKVFDIPGYLRRPLDNALGELDLAFAFKGGVLDRNQNWC